MINIGNNLNTFSKLVHRHYPLVIVFFVYVLMVLFVALRPSVPVWAGNSASFQVRDDQIGGNQFSQESTNFQVFGGVEPLVGSQTGVTFRQQTGSPLPVGNQTPATPSTPSGGTGENCPAPGNISLTGVSCNRVYKSLVKLSGTRSTTTPMIFVDDDMAGVFLGSNTTWSKDVYVVSGENKIVIYGKNNCDAMTPPITIVLTKAKMGDTNDDLSTNDYDLSTFTRRWERKEDCLTDFNQDRLTNDYDLSLLASAWTG